MFILQAPKVQLSLDQQKKLGQRFVENGEGHSQIRHSRYPSSNVFQFGCSSYV